MELRIEIASAMAGAIVHHTKIVALSEVRYIGLVPAHSKINKNILLVG